MTTVDPALLLLKRQIDAKAPGRRTDSDGFKGDAAHQARESQHNPESPPPPGNPDNEVDAGDFTHDPDSGADMGHISEHLRLSRDRRIHYVIFNGRIFSSYSVGTVPPFTWRPYSGTNPHSGHMHVSRNDLYHGDVTPWSIGMHPRDEKALINRVNAMIDMAEVNPYGDNLQPETNQLAAAVRAIASVVTQISAQVQANAHTLSQVKARLDVMGTLDLPGSMVVNLNGKVALTPVPDADQ